MDSNQVLQDVTSQISISCLMVTPLQCHQPQYATHHSLSKSVLVLQDVVKQIPIRYCNFLSHGHTLAVPSAPVCY